VILHRFRPVEFGKLISVLGILVATAVIVIAILGAGPGVLGIHRSGAGPAPRVTSFRIGDTEASIRTKLGPPAMVRERGVKGRRVDSWYYGTLPRRGPYTFVFVNGKLR
jgi:hypothetical protein